jgi:hypothetical protein
MDRARPRELADEYRRRPREAGVYLIRDGRTGLALLGSTPDLASVRNRLSFARATGTASAVDGRLVAAIPDLALDELTLEVVDTLELTPGMTDAQIRDDLVVLEAAWREQLGEGVIG